MEQPVLAYLKKPYNGQQHGLFSIVGIMENNEFCHIDKKKSKEMFRPEGDIFSYKLFINHPDLKAENFYKISYYPNPSEKAGTGGYTSYILSERDEIALVGIPVFEASFPEITKKDFLSLEIVRQKISLQLIEEKLKLGFDTDFYIWTKHGLIKCFFETDGVDFLKYWHNNEEFLLKNRDKLYFTSDNEGSQCGIVLGDIEGESFTIDTINNAELVKWFSKEIKEKDTAFFTKMNIGKQLKDFLPDILTSVQNDHLYKSRMNFILEHNNQFLLTYEDLITLKENPHFTNLIVNCIEDQITLIKNDYNSDLEEAEQERDEKIGKAIKDRDDRIQKISQELEEYDQIVVLKKDEINALSQKITLLEKRKESIVSDFNIIKEVLGSVNSLDNEVKSFVIETCHDDTSIECYDIQSFRGRLIATLKEFGLFLEEKFLFNLVDCFCYRPLIILPDVRLATSIVKSINSTNFIVQQVGIDWISFDKLWNNGLGNLWKSAEKEPEKIHILILENINMSHIDCYMSPVIDIIQGIRGIIPIGQTCLPTNLRILRTVTEKGIGLPIYKKSIAAFTCPEISFENTKKSSIKKEDCFFKAITLFKGIEDFDEEDFHSINEYYVTEPE